MHPTPCQLKLLKLYREYHSAPPTVGGVLRRNLAPLALFVAIIAAGLWLALNAWGLWFGVGCFAAGLGFGALARVVRQLVYAVRFWPIIAHVVDWTKVDSLLANRSES
jgi:hypothetical protein